MKNLNKTSQPDGYTPDGIPVYIQPARAHGKTMMQLEMYRLLLGIPDDEWAEMKRAAMERLGYSDDQEPPPDSRN